jgi:hypothetical protein
MSRKLRAMRDAASADFGRVEHRIDLYRTPRIDCYRAVADGVEWKRRVGWSKVLAGLRVKFPRVRAP